MSKKDIYVEKAQANIDEQVAKIDGLKAKLKNEFADQKLDAKKNMDKLEDKIDLARIRVSEIADSAEDAWEDLAIRFDHFSDELSASVKKFFNKQD